MDSRDHASSLTVMFSMSHLPDLHPGFFHLLELGAYISMKNYSLAAFCGLQRHGGSPPRPLVPHSVDLAKKVRLSFICYPDERTKEGRIAMALGPNTFRATLEEDSTPTTLASLTRALNFATHSYAVMEPQSLRVFLARAFYLVVYRTLQLSSNTSAMALNPDAFLSSFEWYENLRSYRVDDWLYAPGGAMHKKGVVDEINARLKEEYKHFSLSIPSRVPKRRDLLNGASESPLTSGEDDEEDVEPQEKGKGNKRNRRETDEEGKKRKKLKSSGM